MSATPADAAAFRAIVDAVAREDPGWARRCRSLPRRHRARRLARATLTLLVGASRKAQDAVWPSYLWR